MHVLVVDDDSITRLAVSHTLASAGYQVIQAITGSEALERLMKSSIQLVVCDWNMPGLTGIVLCRAIRSSIQDRNVYILMVTGHNRPQDIVEGLRAGANIYVTKPFDPTDVIQRVNAGRRLVQLGSPEFAAVNF